jgi:hypothetical protein
MPAMLCTAVSQRRRPRTNASTRQGTEVALTMFIASSVVPKHRRGKIHG